VRRGNIYAYPRKQIASSSAVSIHSDRGERGKKGVETHTPTKPPQPRSYDSGEGLL